MGRTLLNLLCSFGLMSLSHAKSPRDLIVLENYVQVLMTITPEGNIEPVNELDNEQSAGLFLSRFEYGQIRICNNDELAVWVDGKLVFIITKGCDLVDPGYFFKYSRSNKIHLSFSASSFDGFKCERVAPGSNQIEKKEKGPSPRSVRVPFREFNIIAISLLILCFSFLVKEYPSRLNFFLKRTFLLKVSSYQSVNTNFWGWVNMAMTFILSLCIAHQSIYIGHYTGVLHYGPAAGLGMYLLNWVQITLMIWTFFILKKIMVQFTGVLFNLRKFRDWQLFDLINFVSYFALILFMIILGDFIIRHPSGDTIHSSFSMYYMFVLISFEVWFLIKFIINSSHRKFLIISYLCATEFIPSIIFIEWFFKW